MSPDTAAAQFQTPGQVRVSPTTCGAPKRAGLVGSGRKGVAKKSLACRRLRMAAQKGEGITNSAIRRLARRGGARRADFAEPSLLPLLSCGAPTECRFTMLQ